MATKAYRRFEQRVDGYGADLELCDILVRSFIGRRNSEDFISVDLGSDTNRHPILGRRRNNLTSRRTCGAHLKSTLYTAFIKDLFEDFSEFLASTMSNAAAKGIDPSRFIGDVKIEVNAKDIMSIGNWDDAVRSISDAIFRKLENERSTRDLISKASVRLGLNIPAALLNAAMPYLDARHILVHRDGKTDEKYRIDYPAVRLRDNKIIVDLAFCSEARLHIEALASEIDREILAADLVRQQDRDRNV